MLFGFKNRSVVIEKHMIEVFTEVLERLAFMFADHTSKEELPQAQSDCIQVSMAFTGPMTGMLMLAVKT